MGMGSDTQRFVDQPDERCTEAPIESGSGEEDAALVAVLQARREHDVEDAELSLYPLCCL